MGEWIGIAPAFLIAGLVSPLLAIGTLAIARLGQDELAHPLDAMVAAEPVTGAGAAAGLEPPVDEPHERGSGARTETEPG